MVAIRVSDDGHGEVMGAAHSCRNVLSKVPRSRCPKIAETLAYTRFPQEHWRRIHTSNAVERASREAGDAQG